MKSIGCKFMATIWFLKIFLVIFSFIQYNCLIFNTENMEPSDLIPFEPEVNGLENIQVAWRQRAKIIEFRQGVSLEAIRKLLIILRTHKAEFALYDRLYPSPSDPGGYFSYSQDFNSTDHTWSMTLGNHGWTGGIYTIEENTVAVQIYDLVTMMEIDSIDIQGVAFFSHYKKQDAERNQSKDAEIYSLHSLNSDS